MANGFGTGGPHGFNKGCSSKFREGSWVLQTPEEGWRTYRPKHCRNNNKNEDNSPKTLNGKNHQASPQKFRQLKWNNPGKGVELYAHNHNTIINRRRKEAFFSLYLLGYKRLTQCLHVRGSWRLNRNCNILTPILMVVNALSFSFSWCSNRGPGPTLLGDGFLYCILSPTSLVPKLHRGFRGPLQPGVAFSTTTRLSPSPTLLQLPVELNCII